MEQKYRILLTAFLQVKSQYLKKFLIISQNNPTKKQQYFLNLKNTGQNRQPYISHVDSKKLNKWRQVVLSYNRTLMKKLSEPLDSNIIIRWLHLHCFIHMFRVFRSKDASAVFSQPRFEMFRPISRLFSSKNTKHSLLKNLFFTYRHQIIVGCLVALIFACLNLLVPQLIRSFLTDMQGYGLKKIRVKTNSYFAQQFVLLQILRLVFGEHSKRLFTELAIKVESTLSKRLVQKSLRMARQCTDRIPQSEIYQLENVDLKLIFNLFKNLYLVFEAPITVIGALILLFLQSPSYGMIAIYWFIIAFFLQRELDGRMSHCNQTKLKLIDKRSQVNYQILKKIKPAKLAGCESLLIEKNNNLFMEENHDHQLYYLYSSLYDITLLLLPIMVVVTVSLYDIGEANPITVEQVYVMLSLLQICYNPMKAFQIIVISFHDGMHSLERLTTYFSLPDEIQSAILNKSAGNPELHIKKNTISAYPHSSYDFWLIINVQVQLKGGERLGVIGKKGQGSSSFVHMLVGSMKKIKGNAFLSGKIAYLPDKFLFSSASVRDNIAFYNNAVTDKQIRQVYNKLGLKDDITRGDGLSLQMNAQSGFTQSQLQKIALARVFCSSSDIYILDNPFNHLSQQSSGLVENILREKQAQGVMIIMALKDINFADANDQILILDEGLSVEYGRYKDLTKNKNSRIGKFLKLKENDKNVKTKVIDQFQRRVHRAISFNRILQKLATSDNAKEQTQSVRQSVKSNTKSLQRFNNILQKKIELMKQERQRKQFTFVKYLYLFLTSAAPSETFLIYLIIISAELLHIFIHFFIGHQYQEHQNNNLASFRNLMAIQLILTIGLAGIVFLEGTVSSKLAVIKGNNLYSKSLQKLTDQSLVWFNDQFLVKIADKFNHDYEQVFIAWHNILAIYKNCIILIATIFFVTSNKQTIIIIILFIGTIYATILLFLRAIQTKVVSHYYDYKYQFVRVFEESITASQIIKIYDVKTEFIERAKEKYMRLAAYKLAESYTSYGEELLCDIISIILLGFAFQYGFQMKIHGKSTAVIATTIFLLINLSDVLKTIVKLTVNLETFFALNMEPFMEFALPNNPLYPENYENPSLMTSSKLISHNYEIIFRNVIFDYHYSLGKINEIEKNPLTLEIPQGEKILLLQKSDIAREYLVYAFTRNLPQFMRQWSPGEGSIEIGSRKINDFSVNELRQIIGIISQDNFFRNGTLKENVSWSVPHFDEFQADLFAKQLQIDEDLQNYKENGLNSKIESVQGNINSQLNKKIALLRILCLKPKIVIIKDTPSFLGERSIVQIIENHIPNCTIIKISNKIEVSFDMDRIVLMENLKLKEQGEKNELMHTPGSLIGKMLRDSNIDGYLYMNMASVSPRKYKSRSSVVGFQ